jgi:hypothetical protein
VPDTKAEYEGSDIRDIPEFDMDNYRTVSEAEKDTISKDQLYRRGFSYRQVEKFIAEREMRLAGQILEQQVKDVAKVLDEKVTIEAGQRLIVKGQEPSSSLPDGFYRTAPAVETKPDEPDRRCGTCSHDEGAHRMNNPKGYRGCNSWDCTCEEFARKEDTPQKTLVDSQDEPIRPMDIQPEDAVTVELPASAPVLENVPLLDGEAPPRKPGGWHNGDWWQDKDHFYWNGRWLPRSEFPVKLDIPTEPRPEEPENDPVNHPSHYKLGGYEVIDILETFFATDPLLWQVGKYLLRAGRKDPAKEVEDLEKAEFYLKRRIENAKKGETE